MFRAGEPKKTVQKKPVPNPHLGRTVWIGGPQRISLLLAGGESQNKPHCITHWIGLRENLQETMVLPSNIGLSCKFSHHLIL